METNELRKLLDAVGALGAMPEGYCFCSKERIGNDTKVHEPECADLRAILKDHEMIEFEMTDADLSEIMEASKPAMAIALQCGMPQSVQERANAAWARLGAKMGFDPMTVKPSRNNQPRFFYAKARGEA